MVARAGSPQHASLRSDVSTHACAVPAMMSTTLVGRDAGGNSTLLKPVSLHLYCEAPQHCGTPVSRETTHVKSKPAATASASVAAHDGTTTGAPACSPQHVTLPDRDSEHAWRRPPVRCTCSVDDAIQAGAPGANKSFPVEDVKMLQHCTAPRSERAQTNFEVTATDTAVPAVSVRGCATKNKPPILSVLVASSYIYDDKSRSGILHATVPIPSAQHVTWRSGKKPPLRPFKADQNKPAYNDGPTAT